METISAMQHLKKLVNQITLKDQLLKDKCLENLPNTLFSRLESDIAKSAIRDYEIQVNLTNYLTSENEHLKVRNGILEKELREKSSMVEAFRGESNFQVNKIEKLREKMR